MFLRTAAVGAWSLHPDSKTLGWILSIHCKCKALGSTDSSCFPKKSLLSARTYLLFNSSILWQTSSPWKVTQAFRVLSSLRVTSTQTGQSENVQYPRQLNKGPFLLDILFFTVCLLKAMLQYGCTDCIPFEIIFVQCRSLNWCPTCRFLRSLHSLVSIKKKHGPVGSLWRKKRLSGPLFSEDVSDAWVESCLSVS